MKKRILIVEDNITLSQIVKDWLEREGYAVATAIDEPYARKLLRKESFDLILSDVRLPQGDGISLLEWINKEKMDIPFVIMTKYASVTDAVKAIKMGAKDYLAKPVFHEQLVEMVKELLKPVSTVRSKEKELFKRTSPKAMEAMNMAELVAPSDISVLILGANGTGKESIARSIHFHSNRKDKPFVAVNCGAIPHELVASTFFGHAKGAFTGADADKGGCFEAANGGTLFLDEIGTLPYDMQSSLLRVLQEGTFMPLANFFREKFSAELHRERTGFTAEAERLLLSHSWSGNIRELQNKIRRAVLMAKDTLIDFADLNIVQAQPVDIPEAPLLPLKDEEMEKQSIIRALQSCGGIKTKAAQMLNVDSSTLYRKMKKYGIK